MRARAWLCLPAAVGALGVVACGEGELGGSSHAEARRVDESRAAAAARDEESFERGAFAFGAYCALCHGADATGYAADHAPSLVSRTFLESASDEFIARGIRDGRPGTAMASYSKQRGGPLDDEDIADITRFLRDHGPVRVALPKTSSYGDAARGEAVYASTCKQCHGTRDDRGDAVHLANPQLLASATDPFLRHAIAYGRPGTPMPAFEGALSEEQIDNVLAFVRTFSVPPPVAPSHPPNPSGGAPDFKLRDDRFVPIDQVKAALDAKKRVVIIDARAVPDWYAMHIPGSISVPYYSFARLDQLPKDGTWITAYCACPHHASGAVVDELRRRGFTHTAILDEGILEWKKRDYPILTETMPKAER
jgi:cytochrome c oxidase cbb3-type subunit 3/ubiquinol-cytochrome c reductase cytochrome c subunit